MREHDKTYIYGKHALKEALRNASHVIKKVFFAPEMDDRELRDLVRSKNIPTSELKNKEAGRIVGQETPHQGVIAIANLDRLMADFDEFIEKIDVSTDTMLVLLDELTDPQNVGAIIRSAAAFGAAGVLMPSHNQVPLTGSVVKASAGMVFRVPIVSIGNVNRTIELLKERDFRAYALAMEGSKTVSEEAYDAPALFVVGNEGKGIRLKTFEHCDVTLRIPMHPRCESLNASVSAAVALYAWSDQHPEALK
ncbi:MAG: 23S rRNA (guanosine(2251)-2'-O)-methyltransferase RlmB [Minisyncoccia bacterium]